MNRGKTGRLLGPGGAPDRRVVATFKLIEVGSVVAGKEAGLNTPFAPTGRPETVKATAIGLGELVETVANLRL
jgi:hypothetical protein